MHSTFKTGNKTGLQTVSRPVEQILGFYHNNLITCNYISPVTLLAEWARVHVV